MQLVVYCVKCDLGLLWCLGVKRGCFVILLLWISEFWGWYKTDFCVLCVCICD